MRIGIAADHAGQRLKGAITEHLKAAGHTIVPFGPETTPDDDYPLIMRPLADAIARGDVDRGIFFCGSGIGPMIAANKIAGVRAAVAENEWSARDGVEHVDVNLLTLGERVIGEALAKSIVDAYLGAEVQGGRHQRRRDQIRALESPARAVQREPELLKERRTK
ncbi:MAG: RpiB/LacA/LacB family sugar-phosphate isomerase [Chloroflexota bacterium]|nr:RpiB/LacA/LacB family sugar-phosphate isomerase [Chloroflexota bacterium]